MDRYLIKKRKVDSGEKTERENNCVEPSTSFHSEEEVSSAVQQNDSYEYDVGVYIGKLPSDFIKYKLLTEHWVPGNSYVFPFSLHSKRGREEKRRVNSTHFEKYKWLVFSKEKNGLLCKFCVLFCQHSLGGKQQTVPLRKFVTEPLQKYAKLIGKDGDLENHTSHEYHKRAEIFAKGFIDMYENPQKEIINVLDEQRKLQVLENRGRLAPIIKTVIFHGRQNIPLRGHRDDGGVLDVSEDLVSNDGNFRALLRFRVESGDTQLENHLKTANSGATYVSKTTTNDLIQCCGEEILEEIKRRIDETEYFSVLFDETTDISHISQLSISLRYVHENTVREDFVGFTDLHALNYSNSDTPNEPSITGTILGQSIVKCLNDMKLNLDKCVGVGCDGCSVNVSELKGAVAEIKKTAKNSILCVCQNHSLNLSIAKSSKVQSVRNAVGCIQEISSFFNMSAKRSYVLKSVLGHNIKGYCETRWVQRHESVIEFQENLQKIAEALSIISNWSDGASATKAKCLLYAITNCEFVVTIFSLSDILGSTLILSKYLQDESVDVYKAEEKVKQAVSTLSEKRTKATDHFSVTFERAKTLMTNMDIDIKIPRTVGKQKNRANYAVNDSNNSCNVKSYWERSVYIPILDYVISDLNDRFKDASVLCFSLNDLVPTNLDKLQDVKKLNESVNLICERFSSLVCQDEQSMSVKLLNEIVSLKHSSYYDTYKEINEVVKAFEKCDEHAYPTMKILLKILATLPISVATAERSFSTLRRLKSWMRSRMTEERLTGLALLHVHKDINVHIERVINRFAHKKSRKLDFIV